MICQMCHKREARGKRKHCLECAHAIAMIRNRKSAVKSRKKQTKAWSSLNKKEQEELLKKAEGVLQ